MEKVESCEQLTLPTIVFDAAAVVVGHILLQFLLCRMGVNCEKKQVAYSIQQKSICLNCAVLQKSTIMRVVLVEVTTFITNVKQIREHGTTSGI